MTHKCRGSTVVLSISKSVEPNEEQMDLTSGFQQVTIVTKVQQDGPIPFVARDKPGRTLI